MTNLTPDILRKAVGYADGWEWHQKGNGFAYYFDHDTDEKDLRYNFISFYVGDPELIGELRFGLAALASQLISQVDAMPEYFVNVYPDRTVIEKASIDYEPVRRAIGPKRDENSIIACVGFFEEQGHE